MKSQLRNNVAIARCKVSILRNKVTIARKNTELRGFISQF